MIHIRDILLKAAEDVQSGVWCKFAHFYVDTDGQGARPYTTTDLLDGLLTTEQALEAHRCAEGSIALAAMQLGDPHRWGIAACAVEDTLGLPLVEYNDDVLPDDPFEAGQALAELFRSTADAL